MLRAVRYSVLAVFCLCLMIVQAHAIDIKGSLPVIPPLVESRDKGILIDLVKAMIDEYKDGKITYDIYSFKKSMENVEKGKADFHMPQLVNPKIKASDLPFLWSSEIIFKVVFVLYTNKNIKGITPKNAGKYKIESSQGTMNFFDFDVTGSPDIEASLRKVNDGKLDGWLFAMPESDMVVKNLGLKNIRRQEFATFDVRIVLVKNNKGKQIDKIFTDIIGSLKSTGKYQRIMAPILDQKFDPWQP